MAARRRDPVAEWRSLVALVQDHVRGASAAELDRRRKEDGMTLRECVHHVVEANVVAAGIVTAALGSPGCTFDWSWMLPFGPWMERMRYDQKALPPALDLLAALNAYVAAQVATPKDSLRRTVRLVDQAGAEPRSVTVGEVLLQEVDHARGHFRSRAPKPRRARRRPRA